MLSVNHFLSFYIDGCTGLTGVTRHILGELAWMDATSVLLLQPS